jgi:hypothetical protein
MFAAYRPHADPDTPQAGRKGVKREAPRGEQSGGAGKIGGGGVNEGVGGSKRTDMG